MFELICGNHVDNTETTITETMETSEEHLNNDNSPNGHSSCDIKCSENALGSEVDCKMEKKVDQTRKTSKKKTLSSQ